MNEVLQKIGLGVLEAVEAGGVLGAPGGVLYAAMQVQGATLNQYQSIMNGMVGNGLLTLDSDCYSMTDAGKSKLKTWSQKYGQTNRIRNRI